MLRILGAVVLTVVGLAAIFMFFPLTPQSNAQVLGGKKEVVYAGQTDVQDGKKMTISKSALAQLNAKSPGVELSVSPATGAATFIRIRNNSLTDLAGVAADSKKDAAEQISAADKSKSFFRDNAQLFGIADADSSLQFQKGDTDAIGAKHQTFQQYFNGVEVYAGRIKTHLDKDNNLYAVGGNVVPEIEINVNPTRTSKEAAATAIAKVTEETELGGLNAASAKLFVFRTGLVQGIPGEDHLVWEITVTNNSSLREFVYIDAHSGKFVDQYTGTPDALNRRAFDGNGSTLATPPNYPGTPYWLEGQAFPTASAEANNMITSSKETYDFYKAAFGRDSYDNAGHVMDAIFNRGNACPNASWNGVNFISFCPGLTTDDVTSHEWSHAYTQFTHGLIYAWQPGALNEGYSDVFGETVDRINGRDNVGNSATDALRTAGSCSTNSPAVTRLVINSPAPLVSNNPAQPTVAGFGPSLTTTGPITSNVVVALDAADAAGPATNDACSTITNPAAVNGKIALVYRGTCGFTVKVKNAQLAGAIGVIVGNNVATGLPGMGGTDATITIPALGITQGTANSIVANIAAPVNVTMSATPNGDNSTRWLLGEDDTGALAGALRDMYNPTCYSNPGKVSDTAYYSCGPNTQAGDSGGVHTNSGVVNHAYALLVDGGTYNGQTVSAIGLTKAAHIYFRAESVYQNPASDFAFHADALEQSANDLIGVNLNDLVTGAPSGEIITAADVQQVRTAMLAVEMRLKPTACAFAPLLAQAPPAEPTCATGTFRGTLFGDNFEGGAPGWTVSHQNTAAGFSLLDWAISSTLPDGRAGKGFFVPNPYSSCDAGAQDQTAQRFLDSPAIVIPATYTTAMTLSFEHWIASEASYDGGQVYYKVNNGAFTLVPQANYTYNAPNATLATAAAGNTNPQAGQRAWSGADGGGLSRGTFGKTVVNLTGLAAANDVVQLRWDFGNDNCAGSTTGWYVDNVTLNACVSAGPTAAGSSIAGRVLNSKGRGIASAVVTMTDTNGASRTVRTNGFGNFQIADLPSGSSYIMNVRHKSYSFAPVVMSLTEDLTDFVIRANP